MSFEASANRIYVTDSVGNVRFDTNRRMMYIHTIVTTSFSLPAGNYSGGVRDYLVYTLPRTAEFVIGRMSVAEYKNVDASGTKIVDAVAALGFVSNVRGITLYVSGNQVRLRDEDYYRGYGHTYPARTLNLILYCGNYDL